MATIFTWAFNVVGKNRTINFFLIIDHFHKYYLWNPQEDNLFHASTTKNNEHFLGNDDDDDHVNSWNDPNFKQWEQYHNKIGKHLGKHEGRVKYATKMILLFLHFTWDGNAYLWKGIS